MWRWLRRLFLMVLVLLLLAVIAVQVILNTDLPKQLVVDQLGKQTGLKVEIDELTTGWSGHTTVRGLRLFLPDATKPLIALDSAEINHSGLIALAIGGNPSLFTLDASGVSVIARQSPTGQWNLQQLTSLVSTDAASGTSTGSSNNALQSLEYIHVNDLTIDILDAVGRHAVVDEIAVKADAIGPAALAFDVSSDGQFSAKGQVVLRGDWSHSLDLTISDAHGFAGDWLVDLPTPLNGDLHWEGVAPNSQLRGWLNIRQLAVGEYQAKGTADVTAQASVSIKPKQLQLTLADGKAGQFNVQDGAIVLHDDHVAWQRVRTKSNDIDAETSGEFSWLTGNGRLNGAWTGELTDAAITHSGRLEGKLTQSFQGIEVFLNVSSTGRQDTVSWTGDVKVAANGPDWDALAFTVDVPRGSIQSASSQADQLPQVWSLKGLSAKGKLTWPHAEILELTHQLGGKFLASGMVNFEERKWHANLIGREIPVEGVIDPLEIQLTLEGNAEQILVPSLTGASKYFKWAGTDGELVLDPARNLPMSMSIDAAWWSPDIDGKMLFDPLTEKAIKAIGTRMDQAEQNGEFDTNGVATNGAQTPPSEEQPTDGANQSEWSAAAGFTGRIKGTLFPPEFVATGTLAAGHLRAHHQPVDSIQMKVRAKLDEKHVEINSQPFNLFKGTVGLDATFGLEGRTIEVNTRLADVQLSDLLPAIDPNLEMEGRTSANLAITLPDADLSRMTVGGDYEITQFKFGDTSFEKLTGKLRTRRAGRVELKPIRISNGKARATGRMVIDLREGATGTANLALEQWPIAFNVGDSPSTAMINGDVTLDSDLIAGSMAGTFDAQADMQIGEQRFATLNGAGSWNQQQVEINVKESSILGGTVQGKATINFAEWWTSQGEINWSELDPNKLKPWLDEAANVAGATGGTLLFGPSKDAKAPEPLRVELALKPASTLTYRNIALGSAKATVFAGKDRFLLDDLKMEVADGQISTWASVRRRDNAWHDHFHFKFKGLDLDKLRLAVSKDDGDAVPGELSGTASFFGRIDQWDQQAGQGTLFLSKSNLGNTDIVGAILSRVGASTDESKGKGLVEFSLQRGQLNIRRLIFRNGPNEVLLSGRIHDLRLGMDSPITGQAAGTLRPLSDINLPLLDDADRLLSAFQSNATTFRIEGKLGKRQVVPATISNLKSWIERTIEQD